MSTKDIPNMMTEAKVTWLKDSINAALHQTEEIFNSFCAKPGSSRERVVDRVTRLDKVEERLKELRLDDLERTEEDHNVPSLSSQIRDLEEEESVLEENFVDVRAMFKPVKGYFKELLSIAFISKLDNKFKRSVAVEELEELRAIRTHILEVANSVGIPPGSKLISEIENAIVFNDTGGMFINIGEAKGSYTILAGLDLEIIDEVYPDKKWP